MADQNDEFRAAREGTESLTYPGYGLTRQELAERVNTYIYHHDKTMTEASATYIGQVERGDIRWPSKLYREAFREIFGVPTDAALGFVNARSRRSAVKLDPVKRRKLINNATTLGVSALTLGEPFVALLGDSEPTPIPARVGATDIEHIRTATREFLEWGGTYGGGVVREAAMAQLRWSARVLDEATCPDRLRPELFSAVGCLATTTGYLTEDINAQAEARRVYDFGLACAERAEDWPLRAEILSSMAKQAVRAGRPDEGLTRAEEGLVRPDRLTAAGRALLHGDRGRALAKMHLIEETLAAIGTADEHFAHVTSNNEPPVMAYYSATRHAHLTGQPLVDLAILGHDPGQATDRLTAAAAGHPDAHTVARAICLTKLASLTMVIGDPLQAAALGHTALDLAGTIRSRRAAEELRELFHYAAAHQHLDEVSHLRHRIATLVGRTGGYR